MKSLVKVVRNFKNMPYTLAYRYRAKTASKLSTGPNGSAKNYLYRGDEVRSGQSVLLGNLPNVELLYDFVEKMNARQLQL